MKIGFIIILSILLVSCKKVKTPITENNTVVSEIITPEFQSIIDSANVKGAILVYDLKENKFYSNDFQWAKKGQLPASTFKIPNTIIALETKVVKNDSTLFKWNGEKRGMKVWEQDLLLKDAFRFSCVPCYQGVARKVGAERMVSYLDKLNYGDIKVDEGSIDMFWLKGDSKINQFQQIDFLKRLYKSELSISNHTEMIMNKILLIDKNETYKVSGKTGWSISNEINNGWFVGYIESKGNVYFFATNIEPNETFNMEMFPMIRKDISYKAFEQLNII